MIFQVKQISEGRKPAALTKGNFEQKAGTSIMLTLKGKNKEVKRHIH